MWGEIKHVFNKIMEKLYPEDITCLFCGDELKTENEALCDSCKEASFVNDHYCKTCGSPLHSLAKYCLLCQGKKRAFVFARAPFAYRENVANAVQELKYNGKRYYAKGFAKLMVKTYREMVEEGMQVDLIVPVPLHKKRKKRRGFNQSELIAKEFSRLIDVPMNATDLVRLKETQTQTNLTYRERKANLENAFSVAEKSVFKKKNILLIDDVLTTGSTAEHCAEALMKAGAKNIYVLTFATTDGENKKQAK